VACLPEGGGHVLPARTPRLRCAKRIIDRTRWAAGSSAPRKAALADPEVRGELAHHCESFEVSAYRKGPSEAAGATAARYRPRRHRLFHVAWGRTTTHGRHAHYLANAAEQLLADLARLPLATPMGHRSPGSWVQVGSPTNSSVDATSEARRRPRRLRQEPEVGPTVYAFGLRRRRGGLGTLTTGVGGGGPSLSTSGLSRPRYDSPS
jgi:hypothetical protein